MRGTQRTNISRRDFCAGIAASGALPLAAALPMPMTSAVGVARRAPLLPAIQNGSLTWERWEAACLAMRRQMFRGEFKRFLRERQAERTAIKGA
jgi:hypothetical protein